MDDYVVDLPPEYCQYHDAGCEFAQSCLNCHLPICVYDEPGGKQKLIKRRRAKEMAQLFTGEGKSIRELAQVFGVSTRTVQRALKVAFGIRRISVKNRLVFKVIRKCYFQTSGHVEAGL
jgi:AraC-like DNA-binding protein